jgi:hypothetical protein
MPLIVVFGVAAAVSAAMAWAALRNRRQSIAESPQTPYLERRPAC